MSRTIPQTDAEIRTEFSERSNYFSFMCMVSQSRGQRYEASVCAYARRMMIVIGYPAVTATWNDEQTVNYADNIVMMG